MGDATRDGNATHDGKATHRQFIENDPRFLKGCELAGIAATKRQASKFRMGRGAALTAVRKHEREGRASA